MLSFNSTNREEKAATEADDGVLYEELVIEQLENPYFCEIPNATSISANEKTTQEAIVKEAARYPSLTVITASGHGTYYVTKPLTIITQCELAYHSPLGSASRVRVVIEGNKYHQYCLCFVEGVRVWRGRNNI